MSTQSSLSVPFSIIHPQEHVRLLELPPELLKLIETKSDRPDLDHIYNALGGRVQLKSAPTESSGTTTKPKDQYLHLCTENHVWAVRQVSTSNSVHILSPSTDTPSLDNPTSTSPGLSAFAQPTSTLELLPTPYTAGDVESAICRLLVIHPWPLDPSDPPPAHTLSDRDLSASLPYPLSVILRAKRRCFVFFAGDDEQQQQSVYVPAPELLLAAWKAFASQCAIKRVDVAALDVSGLGDITAGIALDEGAVVAAVVRAVVKEFVAFPLEGSEGGGELERLGCGLKGQLKGKELTEWLGGLSVQCAPRGVLGTAELMEEWQNLLPREWWEWCKVEALKGTCEVEGAGKVRWRGDEKGGLAASSGTAAGNAAPSSIPNKRNWHEKFAAQRKR